tara:strand:+ start:4046 stop:4660 length:615 start_codon:yes stop_codon:yes gene_type:complete
MSKELIQIINNSTEEKILDAGVTKKLEFIDGQDNPVPEGIPYHIHITDDKTYWYMTGSDHKDASMLIFKVSGGIPDFVKYTSLVGSKKQEYLTEQKTIPNSLDYEKGYIVLFFARQANSLTEKVFEISQSDYEKDTPFYDKVTLNLKIYGEEEEVKKFNERRINNLDIRMPGIRMVVQPLQYFKPMQKAPSGAMGGGSSGGGGY